MSDKIFIDTNILVYFYTKTEKAKLNILEKLLSNADLVISTQVLNELSNVLFKKFNCTTEEISKLTQEVSCWCSVYTIEIQTIIHTLSIINKYKISYFDELMITAALESNCKIMYSEDMQHNCLIEKTLHIINPFKVIINKTSDS